MLAGELAVVGVLVREVPSLLPLLQEHLDDYDGVLPHIFIADLVRHLAALSPQSTIPLEAIAVLESMWNENEAGSQELISVSFIEHILEPANQMEAELEQWFGPGMKKQAEYIRGWRPRDLNQ